MRLFILSIALLTSLAVASPTNSKPSPTLPTHSISKRVDYRVLRHTSFGDTSGIISAIPDRATNACALTLDPQALDTPNPVLNGSGYVVVNFVVTEGGRVWSPLVLQGDDDSGDDQEILRAVRRWQFRPATCNGVPTAAEAVVVISQ